MRVLFVSSYYPPHFIGGWEQLVRDIAERFEARGHVTHVITSMHGVDAPEETEKVSRVLHPESDLHHYDPVRELGHSRMLRENLQNSQQVIAQFKPDVIFVHLMYNLTKGVPWIAERTLPGRVVYWVANDWPYVVDPHTAFWLDKRGNPLKRLAKRVMGQIPLRQIRRENERFQLKFREVMCVSEAVLNSLHEEAGIPLDSLSVVHNGVETDLFAPAEYPSWADGELKCLYAGSVNEHKGVHTILKALAYLKNQNKLDNISLGIVGDGHPDYEKGLKQFVKQEKLENVVRFYGRVPRAEMPGLIQKFNVLAFPSIWEEPLSRMMQEGMSAGLVVVGTLTGGSGELLVEGETGLTFEKENDQDLARRLLELQADPELRQRLAENGRNEILKRFSMEHMVDRMESRLTAVIENRSSIPLN